METEENKKVGDMNKVVKDSSKIEGNFDIKTTYNAEAFSDLQNEVKKLKTDFNDEKNKIVNLKNDFEKSKFDLITLIGLFVGLITYLGLEIQVFKLISNPFLIIGISIFFIASILLFILGINTIIKKYETLTWGDFKNPIYTVLIILLFFSLYFIIYGYRDYSKSKFFEKNINYSYQIN